MDFIFTSFGLAGLMVLSLIETVLLLMYGGKYDTCGAPQNPLIRWSVIAWAIPLIILWIYFIRNI